MFQRILSIAVLFILCSCATPTPGQKAILVNAETLAQIAGSAAATYYGGPAAGQAASAGLYALGNVLNGYIGVTVPSSVVQATPGVVGVGNALAASISTSEPISASDVAKINQAAALVAALPLVTTGTHDL